MSIIQTFESFRQNIEPTSIQKSNVNQSNPSIGHCLDELYDYSDPSFWINRIHSTNLICYF